MVLVCSDAVDNDLQAEGSCLEKQRHQSELLLMCFMFVPEEYLVWGLVLRAANPKGLSFSLLAGAVVNRRSKHAD